jgi:hypothetical protein
MRLDANVRANDPTETPGTRYRRRRFEGETIELCVRWYISYRLAHRIRKRQFSPGRGRQWSGRLLKQIWHRALS